MKVANITKDDVAMTSDLHPWTFLLDIAVQVVNGAFLTVKELLKTET